uniref:Uncharacterized protein n=1 Tax=Globodera pallida TaxID=36090 RepID=A0A183BP88_GLOPA
MHHIHSELMATPVQMRQPYIALNFPAHTAQQANIPAYAACGPQQNAHQPHHPQFNFGLSRLIPAWFLAVTPSAGGRRELGRDDRSLTRSANSQSEVGRDYHSVSNLSPIRQHPYHQGGGRANSFSGLGGRTRRDFGRFGSWDNRRH